MRNLVLLFTILILQCCKSDKPKDFVLRKNQDWTIDFQNNLLPSKAFFKDKIYCSSIRVGQDNYLYCLNLKTGKVDWISKVKDWATTPPIVNDSLIYYSSYVGDLYRLNLRGEILWQKKSKGVFKNININPWNGNLMVTTTTNGLFEISSISGEIIKEYANNSFAISTPLFLRDYFVIAGVKPQNDTVNLMGSLLVAFNSNRTKKCEVEIGNVKHLALDEKRIYYLKEENSSLFCLDLDKRKVIWQNENLEQVDGRNIFFSDSKIYIYGRDLNNIYEIDKKNGIIKRKVSYSRLLEEKLITNTISNYTIANKNKVINIKVTDSLESLIPVHSQLNIYIKKNTTANKRFGNIGA